MKQLHILNLGAGVQNTPLYLLSREPDAEFRFDVTVFADTIDPMTTQECMRMCGL